MGRREEVRRVLNKFPDRFPVICTRAPRSDLPHISKEKFLVPGTMLCGEAMSADRTIYLFVKTIALRSSALMSEVYETYKADDGYLYIQYCSENVLGDAARSVHR